MTPAASWTAAGYTAAQWASLTPAQQATWMAAPVGGSSLAIAPKVAAVNPGLEFGLLLIGGVLLAKYALDLSWGSAALLGGAALAASVVAGVSAI